MTTKVGSTNPSTVDLPAIRSKLNAWYGPNGRHALPWRLTRDPYAVLVSEVMLQQTQVTRVEPRYGRWLERWPAVTSLAAASPAEVIQEWAGLGYNRRAVNLWRAARETEARHAGRLPMEVETLRALPGVGPYTASAVACFAADARFPVVDTNVARVLARTALAEATRAAAGAIAISATADALLPSQGARDHNLALMDLGALICTARAPACDRCPLVEECSWFRAGRPSPAPAPGAGPRQRFEESARFARGRLVDALRSEPSMTAGALAAVLPPAHRSRLFAYLDALLRDGLVETSDGRWALPGAQGNSSIASPKL